jgi:hypothetical protein
MLNRRVKGDADFTLYAGPGLYEALAKMSEDDEDLSLGVSAERTLEFYHELGITNTVWLSKMRLEPDGLVVDYYAWCGRNAPLLKWYDVGKDPTAFLRRVPSDPMTLMVARLNLALMWGSIADLLEDIGDDSGPSLKEMIEEANEEAGFDIEADLINQVDGNFAFIVNDVTMSGADAVMLLQLARPDDFRGTLDKLSRRVEESIDASRAEEASPGGGTAEIITDEIDGVTYYMLAVPMMFELCAGVVDDHLVVTTSFHRFRSIVAGERSFVDVMDNERIRKTLDDPTGSVFYMDFRGLARDLKTMGPALGRGNAEIVDALSMLSELVSVGWADKEGFWQNTVFTAAEPGIWKRLVALALGETDEETGRDDTDDDDEEDFETD